MRIFSTIFFFIIIVPTSSYAQDRVRHHLNGRIIANLPDLEGIYVINVNTEVASVTNKEGDFSITASIGDSLIFSAVQFKKIKIGLIQTDFEKEVLLIKMNVVINQLNEVVIKRYDNINAVALGIIPKGRKSYSAAERKIDAATNIDPTANLDGMAGGSVSADPLINMLSGRTAMLKKKLATEKKEFHLKQLGELFRDSYFVDKLKIPPDYIKGFKYYIVENERFIVIFKSKNKAMTEFLIGELALKYNEILTREN